MDSHMRKVYQGHPGFGKARSPLPRVYSRTSLFEHFVSNIDCVRVSTHAAPYLREFRKRKGLTDKNEDEKLRSSIAGSRALAKEETIAALVAPRRRARRPAGTRVTYDTILSLDGQDTVEQGDRDEDVQGHDTPGVDQPAGAAAVEGKEAHGQENSGGTLTRFEPRHDTERVTLPGVENLFAAARPADLDAMEINDPRQGRPRLPPPTGNSFGTWERLVLPPPESPGFSRASRGYEDRRDGQYDYLSYQRRPDDVYGPPARYRHYQHHGSENEYRRRGNDYEDDYHRGSEFTCRPPYGPPDRYEEYYHYPHTRHSHYPSEHAYEYPSNTRSRHDVHPRSDYHNREHPLDQSHAYSFENTYQYPSSTRSQIGYEHPSDYRHQHGREHGYQHDYYPYREDDSVRQHTRYPGHGDLRPAGHQDDERPDLVRNLQAGENASHQSRHFDNDKLRPFDRQDHERRTTTVHRQIEPRPIDPEDPFGTTDPRFEEARDALHPTWPRARETRNSHQDAENATPDSHRTSRGSQRESYRHQSLIASLNPGRDKAPSKASPSPAPARRPIAQPRGRAKDTQSQFVTLTQAELGHMDSIQADMAFRARPKRARSSRDTSTKKARTTKEKRQDKMDE
ncbi:hypothetical protein MKZ38_008361 [Zalerion maritima]|uniref:Uncharacterized protein n=1 Tax=Zalerion maritima TaxID=339359 RepID=A0AAD5RU73_9PEZI|nr:hypothetical protein MKZ38_008361 [Zalerion maritima]